MEKITTNLERTAFLKLALSQGKTKRSNDTQCLADSGNPFYVTACGIGHDVSHYYEFPALMEKHSIIRAPAGCYSTWFENPQRYWNGFPMRYTSIKMCTIAQRWMNDQASDANTYTENENSFCLISCACYKLKERAVTCASNHHNLWQSRYNNGGWRTPNGYEVESKVIAKY